MILFGQPRRHYHECGSTNDVARAWALDAAEPAPHGALVTADFQTRGRGRRGNQWHAAPAESALMSFILRPNIVPAHLWQIGFLAALAASDGVAALGVRTRLKWPNDLLLHGRKVCGVLVESVLVPEADCAFASTVVIVGIGLNINQEVFADAQYAYQPTSMRRETGRLWDVGQVVDAVASGFGKWDEIYQDNGFPAVLDGCRERLAIGASVKSGPAAGTLEGILENGHAWVQLGDGTFAEWTTLDL